MTKWFANVAFSRGSLLQSYPIRFDRGEPLPAPKDITRYFVSHEEAAQICILASLDLEIIQPSLFDRTTTGFLLILGLNNLSQET